MSIIEESKERRETLCLIWKFKLKQIWLGKYFNRLEYVFNENTPKGSDFKSVLYIKSKVREKPCFLLIKGEVMYKIKILATEGKLNLL